MSLTDARDLNLVSIPVVRVDYHGPYLNKLHPAPRGQHADAVFVDSCALPGVTVDATGRLHIWDSRISRPATPSYPDPLHLACETEIARRNAGMPPGGPFEPWIRA